MRPLLPCRRLACLVAMPKHEGKKGLGERQQHRRSTSPEPRTPSPARASPKSAAKDAAATPAVAGTGALGHVPSCAVPVTTENTHAEPAEPPIEGSVPGEQEPGSVSLMTNAAGSRALEILPELCAPVVTKRPEAEPAIAPTAGTEPEQEQPQDPELAQLVPSPATVKQESPVVAIRPEIIIPKTTGKHGHTDKHRSQRRLGTGKESAAKSTQGIASVKSVAGSRTLEGLRATNAATTGVPSSATSRATSPAAIVATNATNVGARSRKSPEGAGVAASRDPLIGMPAASYPQEVLKDNTAIKHWDQSAVKAVVPYSETTATKEVQGQSEPDRLGPTTLDHPTGRMDYQDAGAAPPGTTKKVATPGSLRRGDQASTAEAAKNRKTTADLLASIANLESNLEKERTPDSQPTKSVELFKKRQCPLTKTQIRLSVPVIGACAFLLFFTVVLSRILKRPRTNYALCISADCIRHTILLTAHLNKTLDPCEDYAQFVCSAWEPAKAHAELARSALDDLRFVWYDQFVDTLERGSLKISAARKPLAMYDMCRNNYPHNASQMAVVRKFLDRLGLGWPKAYKDLQSPLRLFVRFSYKWYLSFWITVTVRRSTSSGRRHVVVSPGLYLSILLNHHRSVARSYSRYWQQFLLLLYPDIVDRPPMDGNAIEEMRKMEEDILTKLYQKVKSPRKKPALFSFKDIGAHARNVSATEWIQDFQAALMLEPTLSADDEIILTDVAFLETVAELLATYSKLQLNEHVAWLVVQYLTIPGDYSVMVRYYGSLERADKLLPMYCAHHVEVVFKVLISALGFLSRFTGKDREIIDTGFGSLVSAAVEMVKHSPWMDNESKSRVSGKLSSVKQAIWPPASILDNYTLEEIYAPFPENEPSYAQYWFKGRKAASEVNMTQGYQDALMLLGNHFAVYAGYNYVYNVVALSMGAAAPPAFYRNGTKAMLYGGILFILAMQLARAIDGEGIKWSANGNAENYSILSSSSLQEFSLREECQHGASSDGVFPEVPALEIAYKALTASHLRDSDGTIVIASHLSEKKVFFMTLCYMTCASRGARNAIAADCNKVVRNSKDFAEEYRCPKGSKMNPVKKCSFFS